MDDQPPPAPSGPSSPKRDPTEAEQTLDEVEAQERQARKDAIYDLARFHGLQIDPEVEYYPEVADRHPGDTNVVRWGFDLQPTVTFVSAGILVAFVAFTLVLLFMVWSLHRAFHEELDLLEAHYDAELFRSRHGNLLDHVPREAAEEYTDDDVRADAEAWSAASRALVDGWLARARP